MRLECLSLYTGEEPLTERHLQAIWYDRQMRPQILFSKGGLEVRVVDPGIWNLEAGPDFLGATLEIGRERKRIKGDVEIHLRPSDWQAHKHFEDRAYSNVIAHVTWMDGSIPSTLPSQAISIALGKHMAEDIGFSPAQIDLTGYPFARLPVGERPCRVRLENEPELARKILLEAGKSRLATKAKRFYMDIMKYEGDCEQVLYEWFMEALGYRRNAHAFRFIAQTIPLVALKSEKTNALQAFRKAAEFVDWDIRSCRPNNKPQNRLDAAAEFFASHDLKQYMEIRDFSPNALRSLAKDLSSSAFVGLKRAAAIIANAVIPMAIADGRIKEAPNWLPPEDLSSPMRLTAFRMLGRDHNPNAFYLTNGLAMQGLIEIHRKYCLGLYPDCIGCAIAAA